MLWNNWGGIFRLPHGVITLFSNSRLDCTCDGVPATLCFPLFKMICFSDRFCKKSKPCALLQLISQKLEQCFENKITADAPKLSSQLANIAKYPVHFQLSSQYSPYFSKWYGTVVWLFQLEMKRNVVTVFPLHRENRQELIAIHYATFCSDNQYAQASECICVLQYKFSLNVT